ncbi:MAG: Ribosomal RNA small subunit methyltransferase G [Candidatus Izimaplasma bacterium HR2]|nr:MAG: Ribosomal RNA small subunit methyltransferase G [Candidatus Izimaplasma bacterium HR2]
MREKFELLLNGLNIELTDKKYDQFIKYYELLVEWNSKINLTAITEFEDVFIKHFYDSLCLVKGIELSNQSLLDVGSGAGFPSIPLKIIFEDLDITIIDSLNKRINFLKILTESLNVNVKLIHGRAEEHKNKNYYDIVTARAVSHLQILSELCIPFVKREGFFIALKGTNYSEELEKSNKAFSILGGKFENIIEYSVEGLGRSLIIIKKVKETNSKYPRIYGKIKSSPL